MKILKLLGIFSVLVLLNSCEADYSAPTYQDGGNLKIADPYLQINTPVISFQAGNKDYTIDFNAINGQKALSKVNVYSVFTDAKTGGKSGRTLLASYDVLQGNKTSFVKKLTYEDLKKGITVNGAPLGDEKSLAVGSSWTLSFEGITSNENLELGGNIVVGVLSRFAGIYKIVSGTYYRIGVPTAYTLGSERFIGSIDENTFSYNDNWGIFSWTGRSFRFKVDFKTNKITAPIITSDGLFSGNRSLDCAKDGADMKNVDCANSNVLIPNESNGKHIIKLTYGYFTEGSGPREFTEVLEKVVK